MLKLDKLADPNLDPGSQNLADPTDPDPNHWSNAQNISHVYFVLRKLKLYLVL